jgi:hypothetical protein
MQKNHGNQYLTASCMYQYEKKTFPSTWQLLALHAYIGNFSLSPTDITSEQREKLPMYACRMYACSASNCHVDGNVFFSYWYMQDAVKYWFPWFFSCYTRHVLLYINKHERIPKGKWWLYVTDRQIKWRLYVDLFQWATTMKIHLRLLVSPKQISSSSSRQKVTCSHHDIHAA